MKIVLAALCSVLLLGASALTSHAQLLWSVGLPDNAWPCTAANPCHGGGPNANFVQENGAINPLPGNPASPAINQRADNDYYFAGEYTTTLPGVVGLYGDYTPVGVVLVNEESAERAFAGDDNDLRYHFNLPTSLQGGDLLAVTYDALNLDTDEGTDPRYGIEVYFNGVLVQPQIVIRTNQLGVTYTTPQFTLESVDGRVGSGFDNIVSLKGISYSSEGGGAWMGIDYVQLNLVPLKLFPPVLNNGRITLTWTGIGQVESAPTIRGPWTPIDGAFDPPYSEDVVAGQNRYYRLRQ